MSSLRATKLWATLLVVIQYISGMFETGFPSVAQAALALTM